MIVLALEGVIAFDLSVPIETFGWARWPDGSPAYRVLTAGLAGPDREVDAGAFILRPQRGLDALDEADTVVVPGLAQPGAPVPEEVLGALRAAAGRGTRIASICVGAFTLAAAGLLDGRRATTHWAAADALARAYPAVEVDPHVLYVDNGQVLTSAGAAAGLDLCLHLIRRDHGAAFAAQAARRSVMALERPGGQAQFIDHPPPAPDGASLAPLLAWIEVHHAEKLDLAALARRANMAPRTLTRRFAEQTGTTPTAWLSRARIARAQQLLETTEHSVERIGHLVGFASPTTFRERFRVSVGISPAAHRRAFASSVSAQHR